MICSFFHEEGIIQIKNFLKENKNFCQIKFSSNKLKYTKNLIDDQTAADNWAGKGKASAGRTGTSGPPTGWPRWKGPCAGGEAACGAL